MTEKNIDIMSRIVDELAAGKKLSEALKAVYNKRNVAMPFGDRTFDVLIVDLNLSKRTTRALLRLELHTINDVIDYAQSHKIIDIKNLGVNSATELLETILDYYWINLPIKERANFLIDVVERNEEYCK